MTKNFIITEKCRKAGFSDVHFQREVDHLVCASEYDYYGQVHLYCSSYFKGDCLVGVSFTAEKESIIDNYVETYIKLGYLVED